MEDETNYVCPSCGETIVVPIDPSAGRHQDYVEDCPVCCRPNRLVVQVLADGIVVATAQPE